MSNVGQDENLSQDTALIATFYGPHSRMQSLVELLTDALMLTLQPTGYWYKSDPETILNSFEPPATDDTIVIQLALNASREEGKGWTTLRQQLESILYHKCVNSIWGYTLVYQSALVQGIGIEDLNLNEFSTEARRLYSLRIPQPLAHADLKDGKLTLMDIPTMGNGIKAATVYVALGPSKNQENLVRKVLWGPSAALLMPDLVAHKGYYQVRQYRTGDLKERYYNKIDDVRTIMGDLLNKVGYEINIDDKLGKLSRDYSRLIAVVAELDALRISLSKQLYNYDYWQERISGRDVINFHRSYLKTALKELELMVSEGESTLDAANTTVQILQTRIDQKKERRQHRIEVWLAIVGVAIAVMQLIDQEVTIEFLHLLDMTISSDSALLWLGIQTCFTLFSAIITWVCIKIISANR